METTDMTSRLGVETTFRVALSGDSILTRRVSSFPDPRFARIATIFQEADVAFTNLETLIHDYEGPENYPAAEAGWSWMRSPDYVADELRWLGFDLIGLANNHSLDFSYGGLKSTWAALDARGLVHAGTGMTLGQARQPRYLDTPMARIGLLSMTSTFAKWSRAGASRIDMAGRPGVNPLGHYHVVDRAIREGIVELASTLGWWVSQLDEREWIINPPGLHNTLYRYKEGSVAGVTTEVDEADAEANLEAIQDARERCDLLLVHVHNHEWDPVGGLTMPPTFLPPFARRCIDAGADVFIAQGSHAPVRGIELYKDRPIFYDPGDLFTMSGMVDRYPSDFYERHARTLAPPPFRALPASGLAARATPMYTGAHSPHGGYVGDRIRSGFVPVLEYDGDLKLRALRLHPFTWGTATATFGARSGRAVEVGVPLMADGQLAHRIVEHVGHLSEPFGTRVVHEEGIGRLRIG